MASKKFFQKIKNKEFLIYQMGKVGSTSLEGIIPSSIHFHTLYNRRCCSFYQKNLTSNFISRIISIAASKFKRFYFRRKKIIKIITLVRNPYERNVSHFFQDLQFWLSFHSLKEKEFRQNNKELLADCFEQSFNFEYAKDWFNFEIGRFSGIEMEDIYFDIEKGFGKTKVGRFELLILRMDKLDNLKNEIEDFIGSTVKIAKRNMGSDKWYEPLYAEFMKNYEPSPKVIEASFETDWVEKCFSHNEIAEMKAKAVLKN